MQPAPVSQTPEATSPVQQQPVQQQPEDQKQPDLSTQASGGAAKAAAPALPVAEGIYYILANMASGQAIGIAGGTAANGGNALMWAKEAGKQWQKWQFIWKGGYYEIVNLNSGKPLDVSGASKKSGANVLQWQRNGGKNQQWVVAKSGNGEYYTITSVLSGMALDMTGATAKNGTNVEVWKPNGGKAANSSPLVTSSAASIAAQRWNVSQTQLIATGYYTLRNGLGTYLDVTGAAFRNGANMETWTANSSGAQCFKVEAAGSAYRLVNARSFKVVDVSGDSKKDGGNVIQWASNGGKNQLWRASLDRSGNIIFTNVNSGKVLDVSGASRSKGANAIQWKANGGANQQWKLTPVSRYSISGNETLDRTIATVLSTHTTLRSAYNYFSGFSYREGNRHWSGSRYFSNSTTISYANDMYSHHSGSCYRFASLFSWLARGLGYSTNVCNGWVQSNSGGRAPHGWVEVYSGGTKVCDPDLNHEISGRNWYMQTYSSAPIDYHFW